MIKYLQISSQLLILQEKKLLHHLKKIDLLRGVAIVLVFSFHCHLFYFDPNATQNMIHSGHLSVRRFCIAVLPSSVGWSGVVLFFIISGFLIHLGYLTNSPLFKWRDFFSKRFWRILPTYWLILLALVTIGFLTGRGIDTANLVLHILTFHNLSDKYFYSYNPSFWSLGTEVQLYLLYPLFLFLRKKAGITGCFVLICSLSLFLCLLGRSFHEFRMPYVYQYSALQLWFIWAAGAVYAELLYLPQRRLIKRWHFPAFLLGYFLLVLCSLFKTMADLAFFVSTVTCLIIFDWVLTTSKIKDDQWLTKLLTWAGVCSYSFYLIHQPYLYPMLQLFGGGHHSAFRFAAIFPVFIIILLFSFALYRIVERPSIAIGKFFRDHR